MASDKAVRLGVIIDWLADGHITLADACSRLKAMKLHEGPQRGSGDVIADDANGDLKPHDPGTFAAVSHAYTAGRISMTQYEKLAEAAGLK